MPETKVCECLKNFMDEVFTGLYNKIEFAPVDGEIELVDDDSVWVCHNQYTWLILFCCLSVHNYDYGYNYI